MNDALHTQLKQLLVELTKRPFADLGPDDDLFAAGVLDSFGLIEFLDVIERTFSCKIPETDLTQENFRSVRAMAATLRRLNPSLGVSPS